MNEYRRITVVLQGDEWERLRLTAERDYRRPRDQVRYLVRQALGLADKPPNGEKYSDAGHVLADPGAAVLQA